MHQKERNTRRHKVEQNLVLNGHFGNAEGWFYRMGLATPGLGARWSPPQLYLNGYLALQPKALNSVVTAV